MPHLTYLCEQRGIQDMTEVRCDKRKMIALELGLRFILTATEQQIAFWNVIVEDRSVTISSLLPEFHQDVEGYTEFIQRACTWVDFLNEELTDFHILLDESTATHEIEVDGEEITFKFLTNAGTVLEGEFDGELFTFTRDADITLTWSEFLMWHSFLIEIFEIVEHHNA